MTNYKNYILKFIDIIKERINECDLNEFNKKLETLKIIELEENDIKSYNMGKYDEKNNIIYIRKGYVNETIFHELFHVLSTKIKNDTILSGLAIINSNEHINIGITEGYTELLTERYFGNESDFVSYPYEMFIADILEDIIGVKTFKECYFNNKTPIIDGFSNFSSELDYIHNNLYKKDLDDDNIKIIQNQIFKVSEYLIELSYHFNLNIIESLETEIIVNGKVFPLLEENNLYKKM
jgi:hypothetical protein